MAKRYYWLKLPEDFFRQKTIKKLRKIAGGDTYTIIYLKMMLIAMKQDNKLYFDGVEDSFFEELALDLDEDTDNVKVTAQFLVAQGLMELVDESQYLLKECERLTGSESSSAARVRAHRENKALQCNTDVTQSNDMKQIGNVEIEIEKEIEKELKIEKDICAEVETSTPKIFISLPLVTGSGSFEVTFDYMNSLRELYPAVDVEQEIRKMVGWLDSNPNRRKTKRGIKKFITNWLAREQDRGRGPIYSPSSYPKQSVDQFKEDMQRVAQSNEGW